jgi:hypothetical protein
MATPRKEPPVIIEFPPDVPLKWVGLWNQTPKEIAAKFRRKGWVVQVIGNVVRLVVRPSVKGW